MNNTCFLAAATRPCGNPSPLDRFRHRREPAAWLKSEDANALDAGTVAAALNVGIEHQGRHCELSNGLRGTDKAGRLVWCDKNGAGIGDNVAMVQRVAGVEFRQALELLLGDAPQLPKAGAIPKPKRQLRIPRGTADDRDAGRTYLASRGITPAALGTAEACGMLRYIAGAVLYVGYDGRQPKSATRRGYVINDPTPKRDLAGTDKAWPAILPGSLDHVWVVEGGVDALALHTLYPTEPPTVIVSGGAGCRAWLGMPHIQARLERAKLVTVATEREKDAETQKRTDAQHQVQAQRIRTWCQDVRLWTPPAGCKDVAHLLETKCQKST